MSTTDRPGLALAEKHIAQAKATAGIGAAQSPRGGAAPSASTPEHAPHPAVHPLQEWGEFVAGLPDTEARHLAAQHLVGYLLSGLAQLPGGADLAHDAIDATRDYYEGR